MKSLTLVLALAALSAAQAQANTTLTFQHGVNGYAGTFDTTLMSSDSAGNHGADEEVSIDASDGGSPNHVLLRFDGLFGNGAGQIQATDSIVKATLSVQITSPGSGIQFHDMLVAWNESATWDSMGDGIQANGVEAVAAPFLSVGANDGSSNISGGPIDFDLTASLQAMQSGTVPGYGWALLPFMPDGTNGVDFPTKEAFLLADRPLLTVEVAPVPEPETYALMLAGLGLVGFIARRRAGRA
jgi:hypothetical protein